MANFYIIFYFFLTVKKITEIICRDVSDFGPQKVIHKSASLFFVCKRFLHQTEKQLIVMSNVIHFKKLFTFQKQLFLIIFFCIAFNTAITFF